MTTVMVLPLVAVSRPAWGAWIEISVISSAAAAGRSRAPHGARGLKWQDAIVEEAVPGRAPHGARGLKCRSVAE